MPLLNWSQVFVAGQDWQWQTQELQRVDSVGAWRPALASAAAEAAEMDVKVSWVLGLGELAAVGGKALAPAHWHAHQNASEQFSASCM